MSFLNKITLRLRIFLSMLVLLLLSLLITGAFSIYHFYEENEEYHNKRLTRKAVNLISAIDYHFKSIDIVDKDNLDSIIAPKLKEWADIHNIDVLFYDMEGELIRSSSKQILDHKDVKQTLSPTFVFRVINEKSVITKSQEDTTTVLIAYQFIRDSFENPLAIISIPYFENETIPDQDIEFLEYLITLYIVLFLLAVVIAYFLSNYITQSLSTIGQRLSHTQINKNVPLQWKSNDEIGQLVKEYNRMLAELEGNAVKLARSERESAWKEMAKQVAHEIKNPLTPIQLSAERIKRKFAPKLGEDSDSLEQMTDVIVRQTGDLRRIVDEFSKFARMPEPDCKDHDLVKIVRDAVVLQRSGQPGVEIVDDLPAHPVFASLDATMISQALMNLIKNAGEAIDILLKKGAPNRHLPRIEVAMREDTSGAVITICDNGVGLPEDRARLFEPYVTTRDEGTGLGLPIVKKIIEEHGGTLSLEDAAPFEGQPNFGARAVITLPVAIKQVEQEQAV